MIRLPEIKTADLSIYRSLLSVTRPTSCSVRGPGYEATLTPNQHRRTYTLKHSQDNFHTMDWEQGGDTPIDAVVRAAIGVNKS